MTGLRPTLETWRNIVKQGVGREYAAAVGMTKEEERMRDRVLDEKWKKEPIRRRSINKQMEEMSKAVEAAKQWGQRQQMSAATEAQQVTVECRA